jgi:hypothetical protein
LCLPALAFIFSSRSARRKNNGKKTTGQARRNCRKNTGQALVYFASPRPASQQQDRHRDSPALFLVAPAFFLMTGWSKKQQDRHVVEPLVFQGIGRESNRPVLSPWLPQCTGTNVYKKLYLF